ncbi:VOC family protein [Dyadobacter tibetensis]|uniref:VOC family protein n=1 Tax=Dyadobacter tibetensis TaxID=1211851 RepID=UPI000470F11C|nr:VOC family protein [Dyadobacter tibetensis]
MVHFKPEQYNSLSPYLIVDGAEALANLLVSIFDAKMLRRYDHPNGKIAHLEVMIDDSVVMMTDSSEQYAAQKSMLHVYVPDSEASYRRAIELGCKPFQSPQLKEGDPDRRGTFYDPWGNLWSVSTQVISNE